MVNNFTPQNEYKHEKNISNVKIQVLICFDEN